MKIGDKVRVISNCKSFGKIGTVERVMTFFGDRAVVNLGKETLTFNISSLSLEKNSKLNPELDEDHEVFNFIIICDNDCGDIGYYDGMKINSFFEENSEMELGLVLAFRDTKSDLSDFIKKDDDSYEFEGYERIIVLYGENITSLKKAFVFE